MGNCMQCGGSTKRKMATGGSTTNKLNKAKGFAKPQIGGSNVSKKIYGLPNAGPTGPNMQGIDTMKKGGAVRKVSGGGFPDLNKDGRVTKADILKGRGVIKKIGGSVRKVQKGGSMFVPTPKPKMTVNTNPVKKSKYTTAPRKIPMAQNGGATKPVTKPKPKYVYGDVPGIGGPAPGQAATPGETILFDQKFAAERKAKAAAAKRKAQTIKKGR